MQRERGNSRNHVLDNSPSKIILFKARTGDKKDDNNGISNVFSLYTFFRENKRKRIRADLRERMVFGSLIC